MAKSAGDKFRILERIFTQQGITAPTPASMVAHLSNSREGRAYLEKLVNQYEANVAKASAQKAIKKRK